jgi:hypothetical protein
MLHRIVLSRRSAIRGRAGLRADGGVQCPNGMQDSRLLLRISSTPWKLHSQASHRKMRASSGCLFGGGYTEGSICPAFFRRQPFAGCAESHICHRWKHRMRSPTPAMLCFTSCDAGCGVSRVIPSLWLALDTRCEDSTTIHRLNDYSPALGWSESRAE